MENYKLDEIVNTQCKFIIKKDFAWYSYIGNRKIPKLKTDFLFIPEDPAFLPGVDHISTENQSKWESSMNKIKTDFESSFISLLNALLVLSWSKLCLIKISLRKKVHPWN